MTCPTKLLNRVWNWRRPKKWNSDTEIIQSRWIDSPLKDIPKEAGNMLRLYYNRFKGLYRMIRTILNGNTIPRNTGFFKTSKDKRWSFCWDGQTII